MKINYCLFFAVFVLLFSCKESEDVATVTKASVIEYTPSQNVDSMKVTSSLPTYVFSSNYQEVGLSLVNRMKNRIAQLDTTVKTIIINNDCVASLTDNDYAKIADIYYDKGNIVYLYPTRSVWNDFNARFLKAIVQKIFAQVMAEDSAITTRGTVSHIGNSDTGFFGVDDAGETHDNEHFCDMVALRWDDVYYLSDLDDADSVLTSYSTEVDDSGNVISVIDSVREIPVPTPYICGVHADNITSWLNEQPNFNGAKQALFAQGREMLRTRGESDLSSLMSAQEVHKEFDIHTTGVFSSVATARVQYDIWGVNDLDKHADYYLVKQRIDSYNDQLNCGPEDKAYFYERRWGQIKKALCYGGYMKNINTNSYIENANNYTLMDSKPATTNGSTSYSSGFSWNLGGNVGLTTQPAFSLGLSGGVSFNSSTTTSVSDLTVNSHCDGRNAKWSFEAQSARNTSSTFKSYHSLVANCQKHTCSVETSWIWKVPDATGTYNLKGDVDIETEIYVYHTKGLVDVVNHDNQHNYYTCSLALNPPCRYVQTWKLSCVSGNTTDEAIDSFLKNKYPSWSETLKLYSVYDNNDVVEKYWENFIKLLNSDKQDWRDKHHTGTFTFKIKKEGDTNYLHEYVFTVNE